MGSQNQPPGRRPLLFWTGWLVALLGLWLGTAPAGGEATPPTVMLAPGECGWQLTLADEFDGTRLDLGRWTPTYPTGGVEWQRYVPAAVQVQDGHLRLRAELQPTDGYTYTSGVVTTQASFRQLYGHFEVRARLPEGTGLWPAVWLLPDPAHYPAEIDVLELLGQQIDTVYFSYHWRDAAGEHQSHTQSYAGPDFSAEFHTFTLIWRPASLIWYVDGVERARATEGVPDQPMFLLANLAVGGQWPGYPDATTLFPSEMLIDYLRVSTWECRPLVSP